jgi:hypothetical protein
MIRSAAAPRPHLGVSSTPQTALLPMGADTDPALPAECHRRPCRVHADGPSPQNPGQTADLPEGR